MTELIWGDKATGKKCAPPRITLPFQPVETVNESADRDRNLSLFGGRQTEWRDCLSWGDKKLGILCGAIIKPSGTHLLGPSESAGKIRPLR